MSKRVFSTDNGTTMEAKNPFSPFWPGLVIGVIFLAVAAAPTLLHRSVQDQVSAMALVSLVGGIGVWDMILLVRRQNRKLRGEGDVFRSYEDFAWRIRNFILDNPTLATSVRVRNALLPTDEELAAVPFHETFKKTLRDVRSGNLRKCSSGPLELREFCLLPAGHCDGCTAMPVPVQSRTRPLASAASRSVSAGPAPRPVLALSPEKGRTER